ncbi:Semaphorin-4F [Acipenser ruthenus]|uniref:Semaphorin-4F n=1 Tax=Acipenser ruthenus TaxID=7906 RepID=A0A444V730_ACIRT|nr:Semaphorin-4F [Acipenser ruthenus]
MEPAWTRSNGSGPEPVQQSRPGAGPTETAAEPEPNQYLDPRLVQRFSQSGISNYSVLLLHPSSGALYVGAKDAIFSLQTKTLTEEPRVIYWNVSNSNHESCKNKGKREMECHNYIRLLQFLNETHIYACGTYAFDPQCAYISLLDFTLERLENGELRVESGRGKCPFEPSHHYTAVMADGVLYAATVNNFLGTESLISRATGKEGERIRTQTSVSWLSEPEFVSSAFVPESQDSSEGDDDKIYFFFTEIAREFEFYTKVKVPRVARVCKGDIGGLKTLQKRWTTFLKAQLVCENPVTGARYNILRDVFTLQREPGSRSSTRFYGLFTSQWERDEVSAVCAYDLQEVSQALAGSYKEVKRDCNKPAYPEPDLYPRPGACLTSSLKVEGFPNSLSLPDKVLTFVRDHPLMEQPVKARPLLEKKGTKYTKIAVSLAPLRLASSELDSTPILYLGTDQGELHRAVEVGEQAMLIEETVLFPSDEPIQNIQLDKDSLYVGSSSAVVKLPLVNCSKHSSCQDCVLARDPLCGWDPSQSACVQPGKSQGVLQDVEHGEAFKLCPDTGKCDPQQTVVKAALGIRMVLPCMPPSSWSRCVWKLPKDLPAASQRADGLEVIVSQSSLGEYSCSCMENEISCDTASYTLEVGDPTMAAVGSGSRKYTMGISFFCLLLGVLLGALGFWSFNRFTGSKLRHTEQRYAETPNSPSILSEGMPLTEKKNRLNGLNIYANVNEVCDEAKENGNTLTTMKHTGAPLASCEESSI